MVGSSKNPQKLHNSCLCTRSGQEGEGRSVVRLRGACLGGGGKDRSWQATTQALGEEERESPGPLGLRISSQRGFPEGAPGRQSTGDLVGSQTSWEYSYARQKKVGGSSLNEMLRYLIMAVRSKAKVNRKVWCQQLGPL